MRGIPASARRYAIQLQIEKEKDRIIKNLTENTSYKVRAITKVVRMILLNGPYLINRRSREIKTRSLGAGIYEISLVPLAKSHNDKSN